MNIFKSIDNEAFPVLKTTMEYRNRLPSLTVGLKESIKRKNKLYRISLKHRTHRTHNVTLFREYGNKLSTLLKKNPPVFDLGKQKYLKGLGCNQTTN